MKGKLNHYFSEQVLKLATNYNAF